MKSTKNVLFVPTLNIDITCTPGCVIHSLNEKGFLDKEECKKRVEELNQELMKEIGDPDKEPENEDDGFDEEFEGEFYGYSLSESPFWDIEEIKF